jgi:fructose-bisphosphate aldolase, class I
VWAETFKYLADQGVVFEGILLKPSMVTPGAGYTGTKPSPEVIADYTLKMLRRRVPPAVPGALRVWDSSISGLGRGV